MEDELEEDRAARERGDDHDAEEAEEELADDE